MIKQGYEPRMAAGVVAISGALAMLLVPIRLDSKGLYYQAIFNNPQVED